MRNSSAETAALFGSRALLEQQAHGGDGGFDLMRPHGVVVLGLAAGGAVFGVELALFVPELAQQRVVGALNAVARFGKALYRDANIPQKLPQRPHAPAVGHDINYQEAQAGYKAERRRIQHRFRRQAVQIEHRTAYRGAKQEKHRPPPVLPEI